MEMDGDPGGYLTSGKHKTTGGAQDLQDAFNFLYTHDDSPPSPVGAKLDRSAGHWPRPVGHDGSEPTGEVIAVHVVDLVGGHPRHRTRPGSHAGDYIEWLTIKDQAQAVLDDVEHIRTHPLVPKSIPVYGFIYDVRSGHTGMSSGAGR